MLNAEFYNFTQQVQGTLYGAMFAARTRLEEELPTLPPMIQIRQGYAESPGWFLIQAAEFDPEPLTVENLRIRDIYASERIVGAVLEMLAGEQWLARRGDAYHFTKSGRDMVKLLRGRSVTMLSVMEAPLPDKSLNRLESLLGRIIAACLQQTKPPGTWCLTHSRNRAPADDASPLLKISQYCSDFNAFRDDAHMAAWQSFDISGHAWEAFSFISDGQANSAQTVYEQIPFRGYTAEEYNEVLQGLVSRQWLTANADDTYSVTDEGKSMWAQVEQLTDKYFYAPWSTLAEDEVLTVKDLLNQLHERCQELAKT